MCEYKIGDRVKVYEAHRCLKGIVVDVHPDECLVIRLSSIAHSNLPNLVEVLGHNHQFYHAHQYACRHDDEDDFGKKVKTDCSFPVEGFKEIKGNNYDLLKKQISDPLQSEIKRLEEIINRRIKDFEGAIECFARAGLGISYKIQKLEEELKRLCQDKAKQES